MLQETFVQSIRVQDYPWTGSSALNQKIDRKCEEPWKNSGVLA